MCPGKTGITKLFWLCVPHFMDNGKPTWATDWKICFSQRETSSGFRLLLSINSCQKVRRLSRANKSWASVLQDFCPLSRKSETIAIHVWALLPERNLLWIQQISGRSWLARLESCVTQFLWSQYELYWLAQGWEETERSAESWNNWGELWGVCWLIGCGNFVEDLDFWHKHLAAWWSYSLRRGMLGEELGGILWVQFWTLELELPVRGPSWDVKHTAGYMGLEDGGEGTWGAYLDVSDTELIMEATWLLWDCKQFLAGKSSLQETALCGRTLLSWH